MRNVSTDQCWLNLDPPELLAHFVTDGCEKCANDLANARAGRCQYCKHELSKHWARECCDSCCEIIWYECDEERCRCNANVDAFPVYKQIAREWKTGEDATRLRSGGK